MDLKNTSVLITGAAKRVGAAIAQTLAKANARHIVLHYNRSKKDAETLARQLENLGAAKISLVQADLEQLDSCRRLAKEAKRLAPELNAVVFNASLYEKQAFGKITESDWDRHMDINLKSVFFIAQELAPTLKNNAPSKIVMLGDWAGLRPYIDYLPYCLSKTGVLYLTHALAKALAPQVQVNAVLPGPVMLPEDLSSKQREAIRKATLLKRLGSPEAVAKAVRFFLQDAEFSTGAWLTVDGGRFIA